MEIPKRELCLLSQDASHTAPHVHTAAAALLTKIHTCIYTHTRTHRQDMSIPHRPSLIPITTTTPTTHTPVAHPRSTAAPGLGLACPRQRPREDHREDRTTARAIARSPARGRGVSSAGVEVCCVCCTLCRGLCGQEWKFGTDARWGVLAVGGGACVVLGWDGAVGLDAVCGGSFFTKDGGRCGFEIRGCLVGDWITYFEWVREAQTNKPSSWLQKTDASGFG